MIGKILGKALALPVRIINVPVKVATVVLVVMCGEEPCKPEPNALDTIAETIEDELRRFDR